MLITPTEKSVGVSDFCYCPDLPGIVGTELLDILEFSSLLFLFEIRNGNQNNYDDRQCKEQE